MEYGLPGATPEDNSGEQPAPKNKLTKALHRLGLFSGTSKEADEQDKEGEKPKKFRRFFKGLFKNIVEKPQGLDQATERPRAFQSESLFGLAIEHPSESEEDTASQRDIVPESASYESQPHNEVATGRPEGVTESTELTEDDQLEQSVPDSDTLITSPHPVESASISEEVMYTASPIVQEQNASKTVEKEVVVERHSVGNALPVALVGLEYLARKKADKKLDSKLREKISLVEKEVTQNTESKRELQALVKENQEQLESLKREKNLELPKIETRQPRVDKLPSAQPERLEQRRETLPELERVQAREKPEGAESRVLLKEVEKAAEKDVPVERVFERSHEVKDDTAFTSVGAASIGSIVAGRADQQSVSQITSKKSIGPTIIDDDLPVMHDDPRTGLYAQAVKNGFWAAMVIILLGVVAYLLK